MSAAADRIAAARAIAPALVCPPLTARLGRWAAGGLALGVFASLCASIGLTPATLFAGLDKLGVFFAAMIPLKEG